MQKALIWQPTAGARVRNIVTFFSSHPGQESFETGETAGHGSVGYFTDTLVNALSGKVPQTLQQPDNIVTVNSIYGYLTREVARRVAKDFPERTQNPFMYQSGGQDVALTFPTPACEPPASCPTGRLRLRLPRAALNNAGLVVTRNHFKVDQADLYGAMTVSPGPQYLQVKLPSYTDWSRDVQVLEGTVTST